MKVKRKAHIVIETDEEELRDFVELLGAIHDNLMKKWMRTKDEALKAELSRQATKAQKYQRELSGYQAMEFPD